MLLSHRCSLAWVSSTNTAIYQASVHSCRAWANGAWQYNHAGVNYLGDGIQPINLPGVRAQLCSISQQSATVQSRRCSMPWGWSPTHQLTWCQCTVVQHKPTEHDSTITQVFNTLGMESNTSAYLVSVHSCAAWANGAWRWLHAWCSSAWGWSPAQTPPSAHPPAGTSPTLAAGAPGCGHTWKPEQHTLYTVTVQAYLEARFALI